MPLSPDEIRRIALLARLEIDDAQVQSMGAQLNDIFALIAQMQSVDTRGVEPMPHAQDMALRLREDKVTESDLHAEYQAIAPQVEADLYLVPKVIE